MAKLDIVTLIKQWRQQPRIIILRFVRESRSAICPSRCTRVITFQLASLPLACAVIAIGWLAQLMSADPGDLLVPFPSEHMRLATRILACDFRLKREPALATCLDCVVRGGSAQRCEEGKSSGSAGHLPSNARRLLRTRRLGESARAAKRRSCSR
jgi:hypothetical protein